MNYTPIYVAQAQGFFARQGIAVNLVAIPAVAPALIAGNIDFAATGSDNAIVAAAAGYPTPIIVALQQHQARSIVVQKRYAAAAKLPWPLNARAIPKGFTVGTTARGTGGDTLISGVFGEAGLKEGPDYSVVSLGTGQNITAALAAGRIDAAVSWGPFDSIQTGPEGAGVFLVNTARNQGPQALYDSFGAAIVSTQDYIHENRAIAKGVVAAIAQAEQWMHNPRNVPRLVAILTTATGVADRAAVRRNIPDIVRLASPNMTCARLANQVRAFVKLGTITSIPGCDQIRDAKLVPTRVIPSRKTKPGKTK